MSRAVRIWEDNFEVLNKITSKAERNALCFALISYGFSGEVSQDLKLNKNNLLLFEVLKNNFIAKNQGGAPIGNNNRCSTVEKNKSTVHQPLSENIKHKTENNNNTKVIIKQKNKTVVSENWKPKEATIARLVEKGLDADKVTEKFINSCQSKGLKYVDFDKAVLSWDWSRDESLRVEREEKCWF